MDKTKGSVAEPVSSEHGPLALSLGPWEIEPNFPYGFVVRNTDPNSTETEYHFYYESNGWVTTKIRGEITGVFGPPGKLGLTPYLCDQKSTKNQFRIQVLKEKGQELTEAESKELLTLCGLLKG